MIKGDKKRECVYFGGSLSRFTPRKGGGRVSSLSLEGPFLGLTPRKGGGKGSEMLSSLSTFSASL